MATRLKKKKSQDNQYDPRYVTRPWSLDSDFTLGVHVRTSTGRKGVKKLGQLVHVSVQSKYKQNRKTFPVVKVTTTKDALFILAAVEYRPAALPPRNLQLAPTKDVDACKTFCGMLYAWC